MKHTRGNHADDFSDTEPCFCDEPKELSTTGENNKIVNFHTLVEPSLLDRAAQLNKLSEVSQVALGICLVAIKEQKLYEPQYKSWKDYYSQELGRVKSDISKLLFQGERLLSAGFTQETAPAVGWTKLYVALQAFPDKPVEYAIAEAQSNTVAAMLENSRDYKLPSDHVHAWEKALHCTDPDCGKYTNQLTEPF